MDSFLVILRLQGALPGAAGLILSSSVSSSSSSMSSSSPSAGSSHDFFCRPSAPASACLALGFSVMLALVPLCHVGFFASTWTHIKVLASVAEEQALKKTLAWFSRENSVSKECGRGRLLTEPPPAGVLQSTKPASTSCFCSSPSTCTSDVLEQELPSRTCLLLFAETAHWLVRHSLSDVKTRCAGHKIVAYKLIASSDEQSASRKESR